MTHYVQTESCGVSGDLLRFGLYLIYLSDSTAMEICILVLTMSTVLRRSIYGNES